MLTFKLGFSVSQFCNDILSLDEKNSYAGPTKLSNPGAFFRPFECVYQTTVKENIKFIGIFPLWIGFLKRKKKLRANKNLFLKSYTMTSCFMW